MSRPVLLILAALLLGCRTPPEGEKLGSLGSSVAGTEAERSKRSSHSRTGVGPSSKPASSLIAVATTSASEAQPCERVCGSLGDCLLADSSYTTNAAGGLELVCLDLCVHSDETATAKTEFLACGAHGECSQLTACAERTWASLAAARKGPEVAGVIAASGDPCTNGCRWLMSCSSTGRPPGEAQLDPWLEQYMNECGTYCENGSSADRDFYIKMANCLPDHCSIEGYSYCYSY